MGIRVNAGSAGTGLVAPPFVCDVGDALTFQDSISSPVPSSRLWTWESFPDPLATAPTITTPTAADASCSVTEVGTWTLMLTRIETDGTRNQYRVAILARNTAGDCLPSPGFDPSLLAPSSALAASLGWAGSAQVSTKLLNSYLRTMRADVDAGGAPTVVAWGAIERPIVLTGNRSTTYTGPSPMVLSRAATGHELGGKLQIHVPAGVVADVEAIVSKDFNVGGCVYDDATETITDWVGAEIHDIVLEHLTAQSVGVVFGPTALDTTAPTINSATVDGGNPNALVLEVVVGSDPAALDMGNGLTGFSLTGTSIQPTGVVESGNGSSAPTLTLTSAFDGSETGVDLIIGAGRLVTSLRGNKLATGTIPVTVTGFTTSLAAILGGGFRVFEGGVRMLPTIGGDLTTWTEDSLPNTLQIVPEHANKPQRVAGAPGTAALTFTTATDQRAGCAYALTAGTDFAIFGMVSSADGAEWTFLNFNTNGVDNIRAKLQIFGAGIRLETYDGAELFANSTAFGITLNQKYVFSVKRVAGLVTVRVAGVAPNSTANAAALTTLTHMTIGAETAAGGGALEAGNGKVFDLAVGTTYGVGVEDAAFAYIAGR